MESKKEGHNWLKTSNAARVFVVTIPNIQWTSIGRPLAGTPRVVALTLETLRSKLFISSRSSGEKLIKYQANSSCVIMSIILITNLFYKALILQGEIWCWSLLRLKGLMEVQLYSDN